MPSLHALSVEDRQFFGMMAEAAALNPFTETYVAREAQLAGCDPATPTVERLKLMADQVRERIQRLEAAGAATLKKFEGEERLMVQHAFLFDIYHRFIEVFDQLIADQIAAGERALPVPFAAEVLALLARRGFIAENARRYLAIFYQIRRAYYFIDRGLVGRSPCMQQLRRHLWNNVFTHDIRLYEQHLWNRMEDFSTVLLGETGTGKGTAAAAIGRSGFIPYDPARGCFAESFTRSFLALNLSQYPETLIESELFGHRKGSFTGAIADHEGAFGRCSPCGAIFLDEIGDVAVPVQIKLLQVLQERTFSPVGSHDKLRFRGRVIAATNQALDRLRASGRFRDDFFYRLCSDVITVPPLRQRIAEDPAELGDLIALIVGRLTGAASPALVALARCALAASPGRDYPWPGNVRELEQAVRRVLLTHDYAGDHRAVAPDLGGQLQAGLAAGTLAAEDLLAGYCRLLYERHGTYEEVARRTRLDRRTVKAYVLKQAELAGDREQPDRSA
jgi:DNA-binding NtrC family response regulator